jgi:integrase
VQLLLGHTSVQTTEKHYAPFVTSQQRLLDAATDRLDFESPAARGT